MWPLYWYYLTCYWIHFKVRVFGDGEARDDVGGAVGRLGDVDDDDIAVQQAMICQWPPKYYRVTQLLPIEVLWSIIEYYAVLYSVLYTVLYSTIYCVYTTMQYYIEYYMEYYRVR